MANKTLAEKTEEIVEEASRRLQEVEDSRHDWTEVQQALIRLYGFELYSAYEDWQDARFEELMKEDVADE